MRGVLETELGSCLYRQRGQHIGATFGHTKHNRFGVVLPVRALLDPGCAAA